MSDVNETSFQETNEEGQVKNLNATMQLLLQQYQDYVNRKERLENKALGHLTPLSILLAATVAILIMVSQNEEKGLEFLVFLFFFMAQVYFSILTFFYALKAYSVKTSLYPNIKEQSQKWKIKETHFLGGINKTFIIIIDELDNLLKKLVHDVQMCRIYLIFSMVFGILNIVFFIVYVLQQYIRGIKMPDKTPVQKPKTPIVKVKTPVVKPVSTNMPGETVTIMRIKDSLDRKEQKN